MEISDYKSKTVLTSPRGIGYIRRKILEIKPKTISIAILERYLHKSGDIGVILAIKRYKRIDGEQVNDDPKKNISLQNGELKNLLEYLAENIEPFRKGLQKYLTVDLKKVKLTPDQILEIITSLSAKEVDQIVKSVESTPQLLIVANAVKFNHYQDVLKEFEERLKSNILEDSGPNSWQKWLTVNHWIFGSNYKSPIPKENINIEGAKPDYLFPTLDGHVDCLDIKKPNIPDIIENDDDHVGTFRWSKEVNSAIGQVVNYLYELDDNRLKLGELLGLDIVRPRGIIVAGRSDKWTIDQSRFYKKLSFSLHGIEVITYDHLLARAKGMLDILLKKDEENKPQKLEGKLIKAKEIMVELEPQKPEEDEIPF